MKSPREYAKQLFRLVLNHQRQLLGMPSDFNVERERAKFIAEIGDTDVTAIAYLAADLEADRVLQNTATDGIVLSVEEAATFREMVQTATIDCAASLGLIPPPSQPRLARLNEFLMYREAALHGDQQATMSSSTAALH